MNKTSNSKIAEQPYAGIAEHVLFERVSGEIVILDLDSAEYYGLDGVGSRIFDLVQVHPNLEEVVDVMLQEYEVDEERLRGDVEDFVHRLVSKGFLVPQNGAVK